MVTDLWEKLKAISPSIIGAIFLITVSQLVVGGRSVSTASSGAQAAFTALELAALILPSSAIVLQASLNFTNSSFMQLTGTAGELRRVAFLSTAISGVALFIAVFLLVQYLALPTPVYWAMYLISLSLLMFLITPAALWWRIQDEESMTILKILDAHQSVDELLRLESRSKKEIDALIHAADIEDSEMAELLHAIASENPNREE